MRKTLLTIIAALVAMAAGAQCTFRNTAFKSGEFLSYNLYYNWQFVWVKAGTAAMSTVQSQYRGHQAYRSSLTFFQMCVPSFFWRCSRTCCRPSG